MDIVFNCPKCEQELEVDATGAGSEINCPACGTSITIPEPSAVPRRTDSGNLPSGPRMEANPSNPINSSAAAKIEKHLKVPVHDKPTESLIAKPLPPLDATPKDTTKKIRVKTIRHTDCIEVGHDRYDEFVSNFLIKVGEENIVSISPINYTHLDIGSQKLMTEFGVMIVYKG
jgi:hypothetical protein